MTYEYYMKMAIELSKKGEGFTNPNPLVGAVIVKDDKILGVGYHKKYGENHAEINAFLDATEKGNDVKDASIYVTLEPCSHYGKTPPCVDSIIENKLSKVIIGCVDPNVKVDGIKKLKDAGIEVIINVLEEECKKLNEVFFYYIVNKRPYIIMKYAMTMDGKIATYSGKSKWITSKKSREHSHKFRNKYSAIMVGINTVIEDNPVLNCRLENTRDPIRIILDSNLKIDLNSNICKTSKEIKTFIASVIVNEDKEKKLNDFGIEIIKTKSNNGKVDLNELFKILGEEKNIDSIYVEGGANLHASLLEQKLVNKVLIYIAPKIFGGVNAKTPIGGIGIENTNDAIKLVNGNFENIDNDSFFEYYLEYK